MMSLRQNFALMGTTPYEHEATAPSLTGSMLASRVCTIGNVGYLLNPVTPVLPVDPFPEEMRFFPVGTFDLQRSEDGAAPKIVDRPSVGAESVLRELWPIR
jgi:hypothetical protein